jgi:predicted RNA-binding protein YlxR (DUF448 family)/ribosomal protein L30E
VVIVPACFGHLSDCIFNKAFSKTAMKSVPIRQCIVCRQREEKRNLFRVIRTPDKQIIFDLRQKGNGRGIYFCKKTSCIQKAKEKDLIKFAFNQTVSPELYMQLANALQKDQGNSVEALIGFANRSRKLIKGFAGVAEAAEKMKIKLLILDPQTRNDTKKRVESISHKMQIPLIVYSGEKSLSEALGKENCRCAGVTDDQFVKAIVQCHKNRDRNKNK